MFRTFYAVIGLLSCVLLAGCAATSGIGLSDLSTPPSDERPSDEPLLAGKRHYANADYGLAEKNFRAAVEANSSSIDSWVGLAASYDRLRRFDLADKAYVQVVKLAGRTPAVLNNLGYHYLLMGDKVRARENFRLAAELDPTNTRIRGNLRLLESWSAN